MQLPVDAVLAGLTQPRVPDAGPLVHVEVLGVADEREVAALLIGAIEDYRGAAVVAVEFVAVSVGIVMGCWTDDGRGLVLKVFRASVPRAAIEVGQQAQRLAAAAGLAAPQPLSQPVPLGSGTATVEEMLLDGEQCDVRPGPMRAVLARDLSRLTEALYPLRDHPGLQRPDRALLVDQGSPFPVPHSAIFDFGATADGAGWIDDAAWAALDVLGDALGNRSAVMHTDWRAENVRMGPHGVSAIYDWDSLAAGDEAAHVGGVARAFSTNWSVVDPMVPTLDDLRGFVDDYGSARAVPFTPDELRRVRAGVIHALAYSARCEHALGSRAVWEWGFRSLLEQYLRVG